MYKKIIEFIRVKNEHHLEEEHGVDPEDCLIVEEISYENAIKRYKKEFQIEPSVVYRWAWVFYIPKPNIEDLPLFKV